MTLRQRLARFVPRRRWTRDEVIARFSEIFYAENWDQAWWRGVQLQKNPADLWVYQEIVSEVRPDLVIETGTMFGGSAYYLASLMDLLQHGRVVTIDIEGREGRPQHPRIEYVTASSVDPEIVSRVSGEALGTVMVILDSDHSRDHVLAELDAYAPLVTPGSYLIVEDTNVNGHPVYPSHGPGPMEAVDQWLPRHPEFSIDRARERFLNTFNPSGYLRRLPDGAAARGSAP